MGDEQESPTTSRRDWRDAPRRFAMKNPREPAIFAGIVLLFSPSSDCLSGPQRTACAS